MKNVAKLLLLIMLISMCLPLTGCALFKKWSRGNTDFKVTIDDTFGIGALDFEIASQHYITVELLNDEPTEDTYKDIKIGCNNENAIVSYVNYSKTRKQLRFKIYLYEVGEGDELSFTFNEKTVKVKYNVTDYDFEKHGYKAIDSIAALDKYPEFKEMLLSVKRYEYKDPYVGLNEEKLSTFNDSYWGQIKIMNGALEDDEKDPRYAKVNYLPYLKDSVYYPEKFDMVPENPVSSHDVSIMFPMSADVSENSGRMEMLGFSLLYGVIDPCCTNPKNPLRTMSFYASEKESAMLYTSGNNIEPIYPSVDSILLEKYPEKFFIYELDGIKMYILCNSTSGARAYFEDDNYFYSLYASYDNG